MSKTIRSNKQTIKNKYFTITLYDAEKKKTISKTIKTAPFKTEKELKDYLSEVKAEQREKNRIFRDAKAVTLVDKMKTENSNLKTEGEKLKPLINSKITPNIDNFILDEGTGNSTVIFGSSKRGKTTLMVRIYDQFYAQDSSLIATLFCGNSQIKKYKHHKNLLIGDGFNMKSEKYIKMEKYINTKTKNYYNFLNMFDDIIDTKYKNLINKLILTYRNSNISSIMCLQYAYLLSKMNRANVNNIIIFGCNSDEAIKDMIDTFLKSFFLNLGLTSYKQQYNFFNQVTENFGFFYINNIHNHFSIHRIIDH